MKWVITLSLILFAVAMPFQRALADNPQPPNFGPLASRIGEWLGKDLEGKPMTVSYQWTGGGTSLVETMAKSNKPLMTTMYHADKGKLMLIHYCKLGTQPRMRVDIPEGDAKTLAFTFVDATNLAQPTDAHMHNMSLTLLDRDHFTQEWVLSKDGTESPHRFEFARVK